MDSLQLLTPDETGVTLELANLTSGAATATLATLIDPAIEVCEPGILEFETAEAFIAQGLPEQSVLGVVRFSGGLNAPVAYFLEVPIAQSMADTVMGAAATAPSLEGLTDMQLSAIGEVISQMTAGLANSFSQSLSQLVEVSVPDVSLFSAEKLSALLPESATQGLVLVKFKIKGSATLPVGHLWQLMPVDALRQQINLVLAPQLPAADLDDAFTRQESPAMAGVGAHETSPVTVQPVEFPSFDQHVSAYGALNKNLDLVMDVSLNLTVELGRAEIPIKGVLELTRGSVIELDRIAGESVDLYANGKLIAKGEVVVIEDNFGLRITSIISPADRLRGL